MEKAICTILLFLLLPFSIYSQWVKTDTLPYGGGPIVKSGNNIIVVSYGIYYSTNNGTNWILSNMHNFNATGITSMVNKVFAGNSNGIFLSTNNGMNWTLTPQNTYPMIFLASNDTFLIAGTNTGVFRSTNNGLNWNSTSLTYSVYALAASGSKVLASVLDNVMYTPLIYRTVNNGTSWSNNCNGLPLDLAKDFAFTSQYCFVGFFGGSTGLYKSSDNGYQWIQANLNYGISCLASTGNYIFAAANGGVYFSSNNGVNWTAVNQGLSGAVGFNRLYLTSNYLFGSSSGGVWRRTLSDLISVISNTSNNIPVEYSLSQNYPNPFNPVTRINFNLQKNGFVSLKVFDIVGREMQTLVNENKPAGSYSIDFNGSEFSSGVYFYRIEANGFSDVKRMILVK